jgi:hypothetical protein
MILRTYVCVGDIHHKLHGTSECVVIEEFVKFLECVSETKTFRVSVALGKKCFCDPIDEPSPAGRLNGTFENMCKVLSVKH